MEQQDIDKLLELRAAWDKFKAMDRNAESFSAERDFDGYYKVVWKYGIEQKAEIERFNDEMCLQLLREYRTIGGDCDLCEGWVDIPNGKIPPCYLAFKEKSCYAGSAARANDGLLYMFMLKRIRVVNKIAGIKTTAESEGLLDRAMEDDHLVDAYERKLMADVDVESRTYFKHEYNVLSEDMKERQRYAEKTGRFHSSCPNGHGWYNEVKIKHLGDIFDILWEP